jgi:predicted DNA-binding protein
MIKNVQAKITVCGRVDEKVFKRLNKLSEKAGITQSRMISNMIEVSIDYLEVMDQIGVIAFTRVFDDMREKLKSDPGRHMAECH